MDVRCYIKALSMNHFVQDKFQSTNTEDKFKHIQYMSKHTHTRKKKKHILNTSYKHIKNILKHKEYTKTYILYSNYIFSFNFWYVIQILFPSLYEFTGSGWGLWFSSRKCSLYKLGTQENLATNIKPIWGILEKWQFTRSAFSKLCLAFFLRKTSPYLNCIVFKLRYQKL